MNKQYEEKMDNLVNAVTVRCNVSREEAKELALWSIKAINSIDESDTKSTRLIESCIKQCEIARSFVAALTVDELQEIFPIDALKGSREYESSMDFVNSHKTIELIRLGELFDMYYNEELKNFIAVENELEDMISKKDLLCLIRYVNKKSIAEVPSLSDEENERWYKCLQMSDVLLTEIISPKVIAEVFPIDDEYDGKKEYWTSIRVMNELGDKPLEENIDYFLANYANNELHEFAVRRWAVKVASFEADKSETMKGKIVNFIDTIKDKLTFVH